MYVGSREKRRPQISLIGFFSVVVLALPCTMREAFVLIFTLGSCVPQHRTVRRVVYISVQESSGREFSESFEVQNFRCIVIIARDPLRAVTGAKLRRRYAAGHSACAAAAGALLQHGLPGPQQQWRPSHARNSLMKKAPSLAIFVG